MARNSKSSGGDKISTRQMIKVGGSNIYSAAKSTMGPTDYSQGYPMNEGALQNTNFSGKSRNPGGK